MEMKENSLFADKLPKELLHELMKKHIHDYQVISVNAGKGRYNLEALTEDNKKICIKYNDDTVKGKIPYEKEKIIYRGLEGTLCVPSIIWNENILATEYIENSCTFREWLLEKTDKAMFEIYLQDFVSKYKLFLLRLNKIPMEKTMDYSNEKHLKNFFHKLMYTGPYGTKGYTVDKFIRKILGVFLREYVANFQIKEDQYLVHGDFHLNNVLVSDRGEVYFIDLENVTYGSANIDLAYWYVQVWMLIYDDREMTESLQKYTRLFFDMDVFNEEEFNKIVAVYQLAILLNRRFHRDGRRVKFTVLLQKWREIKRVKI